jgi:hypothetical protein
MEDSSMTDDSADNPVVEGLSVSPFSEPLLLRLSASIICKASPNDSEIQPCSSNTGNVSLLEWLCDSQPYAARASAPRRVDATRPST